MLYNVLYVLYSKRNSNIHLEHTTDPQVAVYEGNTFMFLF